MSAHDKTTDNYGKPRSDYINRLVGMSDDQLETKCQEMIWLSAYANNNPRSDFHWQCDAAYDECKRRNAVEIYERAWKRASSGARS